jgi:NAD(P)-dependent dehydrogenase (short-subunit alcohol dehydrogenase family)
MPDATQRSVVIFGGSSGLGAGCVERFAERGDRGVIADLKPPLAPTNGFEFQTADVTDEAAVNGALALAATRGRLSVVVICAGILHAERIAGKQGAHSLAAYRRVIEVNLIGTFNVLRLAADAMQKNEPDAEGERGVIITTSSVAAFEGQIGQAAYASAKGGVAALTLPAARELGRYGIRVVSIAPGVFETPMMQAAPDDVRTSLAAQIPFPPRFGRPSEFAAMVEHVVENRMLNGTVIRLDGAIRMGAK